MNAKKAKRLRRLAQFMGVPNKVTKKVYLGMRPERKAEVKSLPITKVQNNEHQKESGTTAEQKTG